MTVSQVGRTKNSVTINVSGITQGDRQTYIWIPGKLFNSDNGEWYTLQNAKNAGYISDFYVADLTANNGDITVYMSSSYLSAGFRVVDFNVKNVNNPSGDSWIAVSTILKFEYNYSFPKYQGEEIDITITDMKEINLFGSYINSWVGGGTGWYWYLDGVMPGDNIYAYYLKDPAQNILNAAYNCSYLTGGYYTMVCDYTTPIVNNCVSGADFKALYFNGILYAINSFNLSVSI